MLLAISQSHVSISTNDGKNKHLYFDAIKLQLFLLNIWLISNICATVNQLENMPLV